MFFYNYNIEMVEGLVRHPELDLGSIENVGVDSGSGPE
jgi:hypothetical protein